MVFSPWTHSLASAHSQRHVTGVYIKPWWDIIHFRKVTKNKVKRFLSAYRRQNCVTPATSMLKWFSTAHTCPSWSHTVRKTKYFNYTARVDAWLTAFFYCSDKSTYHILRPGKLGPGRNCDFSYHVSPTLVLISISGVLVSRASITLAFVIQLEKHCVDRPGGESVGPCGFCLLWTLISVGRLHNVCGKASGFTKHQRECLNNIPSFLTSYPRPAAPCLALPPRNGREHCLIDIWRIQRIYAGINMYQRNLLQVGSVG